MNRKSFIIYGTTLITVLIVLTGCSTKKNTALSRGYQAMTTRYNVYYNGREALLRCQAKVDEAYKPDYTQILKMYSISDPVTQSAGSGDASRAVEKCEKAIKEHSMRKKPQKKPQKMKDPKYATFYAQEEFNPMMDDVWMLLGKARYYSGDFLAASATFTYVQNHFSVHKDLVTEATLWKAKALKEMGWMYEAEEILVNLPEDNITYKLEGLYNSTMADHKLTEGEYKEALPYLIKSIPSAKNKTERTRFYYIIGQIYQKLGDKKNAYAYFDTVVHSCPVYEMEFNARIRQTEVFTDYENAPTLIKKLEKQVKSDKNKEYLDQLYYAIGNVYIGQGDTANAIKNYRLASEKSVRNGVEKAVALITLGRLHYGRKEYILAEPCYAEAASILSHEHPEFADVQSKSLKLTELKQNYDVVYLQDSLLALSVASEDEIKAAIDREIKKVEEEEKAEAERAAAMEREQKLLEMEIEQVASQNYQAQKGSQWYFFNPQTVSKGKLEFQRKFGNRRLEDNWNRQNKSMMSFAEESLAEYTETESSDSTVVLDSVNADVKKVITKSDRKNPEYYRRQIPFTDAQKELALSQVEQSLYNEAIIYAEKIEDYPMATETFEEYIRRFGHKPLKSVTVEDSINDAKIPGSVERSADANFYLYQISSKNGDNVSSVMYKDRIVTDYPDSKYAQILSDPNYAAKLAAMQRVQDSVYAVTYDAYLASNYSVVASNLEYMEQNYKMSNLMPKFMLLNSLSIGKQGYQDSLYTSLKELINAYPQSDATGMAKDIVALIDQGNIPQAGTSATLAKEREQVLLTEAVDAGLIDSVGFVFESETPYQFYILSDPEKVNQNQLLFNVATYNFTKFLVKDYDIRVKPGLVAVSGLENLDEALWYANGVKEDEGINSLLNGTEYTMLVISEDNSKLIGRGHTIDEYKKFYVDNIVNRKREQKKKKIELVGDDKAVEDLNNASTKIDVKEGENLNGVKTSVPADTKTDKQSEDGKEQSQNNTDTDSANKETVKNETVPSENKEQKAEEKKEQTPQKKYKNLYTFNKKEKHYYALLIAKGVVNTEKVMNILKEFNENEAPQMNLKVEKTDCRNLSVVITVGLMENSDTALAYLKQMIKNEKLTASLHDIVYKNVIITEFNLNALKESGNVNVYMELFKRGYLGK